MKKKSWLMSWISLMLVGVSGVAMSGCMQKPGSSEGKTSQIQQVYHQYVAHAQEDGTEPLSYEEWLATIKGEKGEVGPQGIQGEKGESGKSAYEIWLNNGHTGTETDFLNWLKDGDAEQSNPQGLEFCLKDDGTYAVEIGQAKYLSKIEIPSSYKGIPVTQVGAFWYGETENDSYLQKIVIPDSVTSISDDAFKYVESLTDVVIGDSVVSIGIDAFNSCSALTSIEIPDSVTSIGKWAFDRCGLTSVVIGNSVTNIGSEAFNCDSLARVYYKGKENEWDKISIGEWNSKLIEATRYYYSESQPLEEGNWWHYVNGEPTVWEN